MAQKLETGPLQINHGHTDDQVLVKFTRFVDHVLLTPEQAETFIAAIRGSMEQLVKYRAAKGH